MTLLDKLRSYGAWIAIVYALSAPLGCKDNKQAIVDGKTRIVIRQEFEAYKNKIYNSFREVIRFPGSLAEYERWKGYECEILGAKFDLTEYSEPTQLQVDLFEKSIEAIVNHRYEVAGGGGVSVIDRTERGLPVRRKRS